MARAPKDPAAALDATEQRLGVKFPADYREFVLNRDRFQIAVKHVDLFHVTKCDWNGDETAVAIGREHVNVALLVFKRGKVKLGDTLYAWAAGKFNRMPPFAEIVQRERVPHERPDDPRLPLVDKLAGAMRRCPTCGTATPVGRSCTCGRKIERGDPAYVMTADEQATARAEHPEVVHAWSLITALKAQGHVVPAGSLQVLATADLLAAASTGLPSALLAQWKQSGMQIKLDAKTLARALKAQP